MLDFILFYLQPLVTRPADFLLVEAQHEVRTCPIACTCDLIQFLFFRTLAVRLRLVSNGSCTVMLSYFPILQDAGSAAVVTTTSGTVYPAASPICSPISGKCWLFQSLELSVALYGAPLWTKLTMLYSTVVQVVDSRSSVVGRR